MRRLPAIERLFLHTRRLKDPQIQVWVMAGMAVLLVLIGHIRSWRTSGEGKNDARSAAARVILAGSNMTWTEEFGPARPDGAQRPALALHSAPPSLRRAEPAKISPAPVSDIRPLMNAAATRPWQHLNADLRDGIASVYKDSRSALTVRLHWSGDRRGNAALVASRLPHRFLGSPTAFVIGNGSRSGDGRIEPLEGQPADSAQVDIFLVGTSDTLLTREQTAALGELLNFLETTSGAMILQAPASAAM